jgi:hypothetical protein
MCVELLTSAGQGVANRASGFTLNVGSMHTGEIVSIELGPNNASVIHTVASGDFWMHFNQYLLLDVPRYPDASSDARLARARQLPPPTSRAAAYNILGDTANSAYPIYRNGAPPDVNATTLATALFDFGSRTMSVHVGTNPKSTDPLFVWPVA